MAAGTTIPPTAAMSGSSALDRVRSSPAASSRLISIPTRKKKIVINPSLMNSRRVKWKRAPPVPRARGASNRAV